jgi:hypothetical protein
VPKADAMKSIKRTPKAKCNKCCERTLLRRGKVSRWGGTTCCTTPCRDGETITCEICGRQLMHICDEAKGCYWKVGKNAKRPETRNTRKTG